MNSTSRKRILLVEDEALIAMDLEDELTDRGFEVMYAPTVARAQKMIAEGRPSVAILDMHLKSETTFMLAVELREQGVPFVFLSGNDASILPEDIRSSIVFTKPVRLEDLFAEIGAIVGD